MTPTFWSGKGPDYVRKATGLGYKYIKQSPIIEREGLRVEIQSQPYDFCGLNDETCDIAKSFRSRNLGYVYFASHSFFYNRGKGKVNFDGISNPCKRWTLRF